MMAGQDKKPCTQPSLHGAGQRLTNPFPEDCKYINGKMEVNNGIEQKYSKGDVAFLEMLHRNQVLGSPTTGGERVLAQEKD